MRILKYSVLTLLLLLLVGATVIALAPTTVARPVMGYYLSSAGIELTELSGLSLSGNRAGIAGLTLRNPTMEITATDTELTYSLSELMAGRVSGVTINSLVVELLPEPSVAAESEAISVQISNVVQVLASLPLADLHIEDIEVRSADTNLDVALQIETQPLRIEGTVASTQYPGLLLQINVGTDDDSGAISGKVDLLQQMQAIVESDFTAIYGADTLQLQSDTILDLPALQSLMDPASSFAAYTTATATVSLALQLSAEELSTYPVLRELNITLDNPQHTLQVSQLAELRPSELQLQLPLHFTGSMAAPEQALQMVSDAISATVAVSDTSMALQLAVSADAINLSCDMAFNCEGAGNFDMLASELRNAEFTAPNTHARGSFSLGYTAEGLDIVLPATQLEVPSLLMGDTTLDVALTLSDLSVHLGSETSAAVTLETQRLQPGLADIELHNPAITGNISYADETLEGTLNLSLANQLQAVVTGDYQTVAQTGQLHWDIPTYYFSKITPLSALITQSLLEIDLVAGSITSSGTVNISTDVDGNLQFDGPLNVNVNEVSGFVADSFFVGFNTDIEATVSAGGTVQSTSPNSASIATLDVGLPLTDIRWDYSFNSTTQIVSLQNLVIETLGGEITVADFSYDIQDPDSDLTVVLANLDLQTIVDLAEYPGLEVEGLISGYLPMNLEGEILTIDQGLIGALQPGGTIRYTPSSAESSGNATLDLVNEALANYHFQIMNTFVYYNENGDLRLEVQLLGNNPDLYNGQVVNLNVNIDDNIPTLLRSLQASRTITDALEQRLQNRNQGNNSQDL